MAANWLLEIGAPFDPVPSSDELKAFVAQCERQWSLLANKGERGSYYSVMLERAPSMRAAAGNPSEIARLAAEAKDLSYAAIDQLVKQAAGKGGTVNPAKVPELKKMAEELIAEQAGMSHVVLPEGLVEDRMTTLSLGGSGAAAASGAASGLFLELIAKKPAGSHKYRSIEQDLSLFDVDNFVDYAYGPSSWPGTPGSPAEVQARAEAKLGDYQKGTSERSAAERLRSRARELASTPEEWQRYIEYLRWRDSKAALDRVGKLARLADGQVSADVAETAVKKIAALQGNRERARELLEGYCASQEPALVLQDSASSAAVSPAATVAAEQTAFAPIERDISGVDFVTCPRCGRRVSADSQFCTTCGASMLAHPSRAVPVASAAPVRQRPVQRQVQVQPQRQMQVQPQRQVQVQSQRQVPPQPAPKKRSAAPIVVLVIIVLLLAAAAGAFFALGGVDRFFGGQEASEQGAVQVDSSSMTDCSASTRIVPILRSGGYLERYQVAISELPTSDGAPKSSEEIMRLNVTGNGGGFSMQDFLDNGADLSDGRYQLVITDSDTGIEYRLVVNFRKTDSSAPKTVELNCG